VTIQKIPEIFSVCKVKDYSLTDFTQKYCFTENTDEENSLVCATAFVPENVTDREDGWRAFRIRGELDFSLVGILARIAGLLAEAEISIFAVSTYNTDYVFIKEENYDRALDALAADGFDIC